MKIKTLLYLGLFSALLVGNVFAQENTKERRSGGSEENQFENAQYLFDQNNFRLALPLFEKLLEKHPNDTRIKYFTALCYASRPDKQALMLQYLQEVFEKNKKADKIEYQLARASLFNYKFEEADAYLKQYVEKIKKPSPQEQKDIDMLSNNLKNAKELMSHPIAVQIQNLGNVVNTSASECSPYTDLNDSTLIYTYRGALSTGGLQNAYNEPDPNGVYYEDVFTSNKVNGVWTKPHPIPTVNSNNNDEALSLSYDGRTLFVSKDSPDDDGDIYESKWINNEWTTPMKLQGSINSPAWEDNCCLSPDGRTLYFCSSRPGGFGGKDIYKATLQADSSWGPAQNLGDKINTAEDEDDPFIHLDGKLFLFSSKGHNSMGGYDIFKTYLNPADSSWSPVENLGYPVNTPNDDIHYSISPGGDKGYYSISRPDGFGDNDLYTVEPGITGIMPTMLVVKGTVLADNRPAECQIEIISNKQLYKKLKSNSGSGFYQLVLPLGYDYTINWRLNDTLMQTEHVDVSGANSYQLKIKDILFKTIPDPIAVENSPANSGENLMVEGLSFKIQVAAHCLNRTIDYKKVKEFGKIEKKVIDKEARFTLSHEYKTLHEVNTALEIVRKTAVPDAFVICNYKGKRCYLYELWKQGILPEEKK